MSRISILAAIAVLALGCQKQSSTEQPLPDQERPNPRVEGGDEVQIQATHVAGPVFMLEGRGGNIGVSAGTDGILMIDDQFAPLAPKIREAVVGIAKDVGEVPESIGFLINTHHHGDHTGGNPLFGKEARIVAHANVRKRLSTTTEVRGRTVEPLPREGWPVLTYEEGMSIHWNGEEVRLMHLPRGHTDGDSVILFTESKVLHVGDHFFKGRFPFVDLNNGGDVEGYVQNVARILELAPEGAKIIPGHGSLATAEDLRVFHRMLVETTELVRQGIAAGKTLEQIQAEGVPATYEPWGTGFIDTRTWLATIHTSLSR